MAWNGPAFKGAMRQHRAEKREEAEERNAATPPERRRRHRLSLYKKGKLAPHPDSRDARVTGRKSGKA
jgi:hypothetical protein